MLVRLTESNRILEAGVCDSQLTDTVGHKGCWLGRLKGTVSRDCHQFHECFFFTKTFDQSSKLVATHYTDMNPQFLNVKTMLT